MATGVLRQAVRGLMRFNCKKGAMAGPRYRRDSASLATLVGLMLLLFTGIASADYTYQQIQQDCYACDTNLLAAINTYQSDFGKWNKPIDGAKYHCGRFAKIRTCYTDCLHNSTYTYSSSVKSIFEQFYTGICDPVCYMAVLPYCYISTVGTYDLTKSCDGANMNQNLKSCVQTELFVKQNCTGVCTRGQRKALFYFFDTMFQCLIPSQTANECFTWSSYCSEAIFGYNGATYVDYANQTIMRSNQLGCSAYGDAYLNCVQQAIDGDVVFGTEPYTVTYNSPCAYLTEELTFLTDFDYGMLVGPFCENPDQSFNDTCQAYAAPTTTTTTATTTATTQRPSIAAATTRAGQLAASTIVAASPAAAVTASAPAPASGNASIASSDDLRTRVQQDCQACDTNFMAAINTYQSDFGKWNKAVDGAKYHCGRFAKIRACYVDCLHDSIYTYSSSMKAIFEQFYTGICDPVCYMAVLPYCYTSTVGKFDITKSCTGENMNQDLKTCVQRELFVNQNCTGVCTRGQRMALFYFFNTMFQCTIPYQTANECFTCLLYCSEAIFGYNGATYINYANYTIIANNRLGCSNFGDAYFNCVQQAIDGDVVFGTEPYTVTYKSPCADLTAELLFLTDFVYGLLVAPFCDDPDQSFNETCHGYAAPPTINNSNYQTLPTAAAVTSGATPPAAFQTTRAMSEARPIILLTTASAGDSATAGRTAAAGNSSGSRQSFTQPLTTGSVTSAAGARSAYTSPAAIGKGEQTVGAGGPATSSSSSSASVTAPQSTATTRSVPTMPKPFASLGNVYRQIILHSGTASVAAADSATVAALLAFAAGQWAGVGWA